MGGAGIVGSGGVGVGGWQIYEEANPSTHKTLTRQGYTWNPVKAPREAKPSSDKFATTSWDCVNRLFPGAEIKHGYSTATTDNNVSLSSKLPTTSNPGNFITCAIMEAKPVSLADGKAHNKLYFKSEVVVKGQDYGWAMWTFVSTLPIKASDSSSNYSPSLDFIYRLVTFGKTTDNKWEVNGGLSWENYAPTNPAVEKLVIAPPLDKKNWFPKDKPREWKDQTHFSEKLWAGIGEIDSDAQSKEKHIFQSIETYNQGSDYTNIEVWGGNGEFYVSNVGDKGYAYVSKFYEKGQGWKYISGGSNISDTLKNWYKPFGEKKIKWSTLGDRCSGWSSVRGKSANALEQDMKALCYSK